MTDKEDRQMMENSIKIRYEQLGIEQGIEQGTEQGTRLGIEQGSKEKELDIVRKMKEKNYPIKDIKEITGLSIEEIEKI